MSGEEAMGEKRDQGRDEEKGIVNLLDRRTVKNLTEADGR